MKLQLTKSAKQQLEVINVKLDKTEGEYYDKATKREKLIIDASLYVENAYVNNINSISCRLAIINSRIFKT